MKVSQIEKKMIKYILIIISVFLIKPEIRAQFYPSQFYPELFDTVQRAGIFADSKTFPDSRPMISVKEIKKQYQTRRNRANFNLKNFVINHFDTSTSVKSFKIKWHQTPSAHIEALWPVLTRHDTIAPHYASSRIRLTYPYVVPGGRFNEMYYWDSYFTLLGLEESGKNGLIRDMIYNYDYLIDTLGFIPNGTRTYFLSRSQPPFFFLMVNLYFRNKYDLDIFNDEITYKTQLSTEFLKELKQLTTSIEKEYAFWMKGSRQCDRDNPIQNHVVRVNRNTFINRYYDTKQEPRPEAYKEDLHLAQESDRKPGDLYLDIRSACESGWDFSSRWMAGQQLKTIQASNILPVDLNALLYGMQRMIARSHFLLGDKASYREWKQKAQKRKGLINQYFWDEEKGYYFDFNITKEDLSPSWTLAGIYPLFFEIADTIQAEHVARHIENKFLKYGGLVTTLKQTGQQWDYPNGWAPLQWIAFKGLKNYGYHDLARDIANRWLKLNKQVYQETGKMMEKYNVVDTTLMSGGGEYPTQDGFGWTNGVYLKMMGERKGKAQ